MVYRTYHQVDKSSHYDDKVARSVAKLSKHLQVQLSSQIFSSFDQISIDSSRPMFKLARDRNERHEKAAIRLLHFLMKHLTAGALNANNAWKAKLLKLKVRAHSSVVLWGGQLSDQVVCKRWFKRRNGRYYGAIHEVVE